MKALIGGTSVSESTAYFIKSCYGALVSMILCFIMGMQAEGSFQWIILGILGYLFGGMALFALTYSVFSKIDNLKEVN